ncbi:hypothetical protein [Planctomicrobium sp. SH527]|uniref:hypothetical protein n=1 Tax=Planctomicrobium sp. SH527 TaxID=3448123 RepID=UPI003F5BC743
MAAPAQIPPPGSEPHSGDGPVNALLATRSIQPVLTKQEQMTYLQLLSRGASPAAACLQLGFGLQVVATTIEQDQSFQSLLARVNELLSQNVAAALYRSAMEGSVSAQTFYLKNRPPPEWPALNNNDSPTAIEELTDDELIVQFRKTAPALLAQLAPGDYPQTSSTEAGPVSQPSSAAE